MMRRLELLTGLLAIAAGAAMADAGDPPARVARLNYLNGPVSFRPGSVEEWTAASLNYPLTTGDHLWTEAGSQAEMHIGSTALRMNAQTALAVLNLDDRTAQLSLTEGALNVHIRFLDEGESFEVDTPNVAVSLLRPGDYRIQADGDNNLTVVSVRGGEAEVTGSGVAFPVRSGESARVSGVDAVSQEIGSAPPPDPFDRWCESRDEREDHVVSTRYVPREMIGYEDLDAYGVWSEVPAYGWVWAPRTVVVGWAPYRYGHWAWIEPWGWTWIDDAPWGFAPFHYGRWAFMGATWVWVPGRMVVGVRPIYAPALVAFVGGSGFGASLAIGGGGLAAWFPLGPGEVYRPAYRVSEVYVRQVNVNYVTNVNVVSARYVNRDVMGAVTVVPQAAFVSARPVATAVVAMPRGEIERARVVGYTAPIAPVRESVLAHPGGMAVVHAPPPRYAERVVVVRTAPPPAPVPFAARQEALRANPGRPVDGATMDGLRANSPGSAPMVRTVGPPERGPSPDQRQVTQPRPRDGMMRNDRPTNPRPAVTPPIQRNVEQPVQPAQRTVDRPVSPVEQPAATRPVDRPAQPAVGQPQTEHPAHGATPQRKTEKKKDERKSDGKQDR